MLDWLIFTTSMQYKLLNGVSSKSLNLGKAIYQSGALRKVRIFTVHAWIILSASRNKAQPRNWKMLPCLSMAPIRCMVKSQENIIYIHHRLSWIWMFWCKHMEQFIPKRINSSIMDTTLLKMWCYCNTQKWGKTIVPNMALIYGVITAPDFSVIKTLILEL